MEMKSAKKTRLLFNNGAESTIYLDDKNWSLLKNAILCTPDFSNKNLRMFTVSGYISSPIIEQRELVFDVSTIMCVEVTDKEQIVYEQVP